MIPTLFKGYPLAFGMLLCLVEPRRFAPRLAACLLVAVAVPYLFASGDYVTAQYAAFWQQMKMEDRTDLGIHGYRDLQMLVLHFGVPMSLLTYRIVEVVLGLACAVAVLMGRRRGWDRQTLLSACLSLALCWMTLAGPATESSTYVLISPVLATAMLTRSERPIWQKWVVISSFVLFTAAAAVVWFPTSLRGHFKRPASSLLPLY